MANVKHNILSAARVRTLQKPGTYTDGATLTLRISDTGNKRWVQRISIEGRQRNIGLGAYPAVGLREAREKAQENARDVRDGRNPIEDKKLARKQAKERAAIKTFWEVAQEVIDKNKHVWKPKTHQRWTNTLLHYAVPFIGHKRPRDITNDDIAQVLLPIWTSKPDTATRIRQEMDAIFDYAIAKDWCDWNPAADHILQILPKRPKTRQKHMRSIPYQDLPAALNTVRDSQADILTKLAIEFLALTATRSGEVRQAVWSEVDLKLNQWTIPPERMKAERQHRVPLTDRTITILQQAAEISTGEGLIFPNRNTGRAYSDSAFSKLFRELGISAVPHGTRQCFRNWTSDQPNTDHIMAEVALAHDVGTEVQKAYLTKDMFEKRRIMMQGWTNFLVQGMEQDDRKQTRMALPSG